ncbi:hypothetical protein MBM09_09605 [Flaviramulus sp. BrNp1-15]|uniref:AEC family transporter n=1 Tax=Flaviramulus sp. BrNp1-15 TaxID=2916754 RepID=UPI001EE8B0F1|nr:hypothetical protein [Flaviramulus sp. BrNp1-15]ULC58173.1 hypothetical protein MBM09_09605 [Flaviramulus sp. BrNp1-15]
MSLVISKILPLLFILLIGVILQKSREINEDVISGLKFIILKISLPAALFFAFSKADLELNYTLLFLLVFAYCCLLYVIGFLLKSKLKFEYTAPYFTGFEFGMLGVALFTSIWGIENLSLFALIGLGHELFIWFVYAPILKHKNSDSVSFVNSFLSFLKSPIIIAIVVGILVNVTGIHSTIEANLIGYGIIQTLEILAVITSPLILIVVGYSLRLKSANWMASFKMIFIRFAVVMVLGLGLYQLLVLILGEIDSLFFKAFMAFIILPPPFILPIMMRKDSDEILFFNNTIIIYTLWSFLCFIGLMLW